MFHSISSFIENFLNICFCFVLILILSGIQKFVYRTVHRKSMSEF